MADINVLIDQNLEKRQALAQEADEALNHVNQLEQLVATLVEAITGKDLNHVIEPDHCHIKRWTKPMMECGLCNSARRTLCRIETMSLMRQGQVEGSSQGDSVSQAKLIEALFGMSA